MDADGWNRNYGCSGSKLEVGSGKEQPALSEEFDMKIHSAFCQGA